MAGVLIRVSEERFEDFVEIKSDYQSRNQYFIHFVEEFARKRGFRLSPYERNFLRDKKVKNNKYYEWEEYNLERHFNVFSKILNQEKKLYSSILIDALETNQMSLFPDLEKVLEKKKLEQLPSVAILGESEELRRSGVNYLTHKTVERIAAFFQKSKLSQKEYILSILAKHYPNARLQKSIQTYLSIENKLDSSQSINDEIWSLSDDAWNSFIDDKWRIEEWLNMISHIQEFYTYAASRKGSWVLIRFY